jgi:hypothetical protein
MCVKRRRLLRSCAGFSTPNGIKSAEGPSRVITLEGDAWNRKLRHYWHSRANARFAAFLKCTCVSPSIYSRENRMPDRREFHRVEICGRIFTGTVYADGPFLKLLENRTFGRGVPLGSALVITRGAGRRYYAICRHNEPLITLPLFSDEDMEAVAREFGIAIAGRLLTYSFAESPAWSALKRWVRQHPEIARACSKTETYVPGWYDMESGHMANSAYR